jgi:hypothetical protein
VDVLGENKSGFRRGKGNKQENGKLIIRVVPERTLNIQEELCAFFIY